MLRFPFPSLEAVVKSKSKYYSCSGVTSVIIRNTKYFAITIFVILFKNKMWLVKVQYNLLLKTIQWMTDQWRPRLNLIYHSQR
jgi:hypothetical protein